jgi:hypothetical protein
MAMRDMPEVVHQRILQQLCACQSLPVVTQGDSGDTPAISAGRCTDINHLLGLVAAAQCIVSTDTAMIHLADAFNVPCLAFFTTHRPEWRVAAYPRCTPLHLAPNGLPEALEFSRSSADLTAVRHAWLGAESDIMQAVGRFMDTPCPP